MLKDSKHLLAGLIVGTGLAALVYFGRLEPRYYMFNVDGRVLYAAGRAWLQGNNPYDFDALTRSVAGIPGMVDATGHTTSRFYYPPQSAALCVPLGLLRYHVARVVWLLLNLLSIAAIVAMTRFTLRNRSDGKMDVWGPSVLAALIIGNPLTTVAITMGQTSLFTFAATLGTWLFTTRKSWVLAGICLGLASIKPQICVLVVFWIVLQRDWKTLLVGGAAAAVLAVFPMISQGGPIGAFQAWRAAVNADYLVPQNLPSWPHKIGIQSLLSDAHVSVPSSVLLGISFLSALVLWRARNRIAQSDVLALMMVITLTFSTYLHDYDYVALAPVFVSMWWYSRQSVVAAVISLCLLMMLFIPTPESLNLLLGEHLRSAIVVMMGLTVAAYSAASVSRDNLRRVSAGVA